MCEPVYEPMFKPLYEPTNEPMHEQMYEPMETIYEPTFKPMYEPMTEPMHRPNLMNEPMYEQMCASVYEPMYEQTGQCEVSFVSPTYFTPCLPRCIRSSFCVIALSLASIDNTPGWACTGFIRCHCLPVLVPRSVGVDPVRCFST